MTFVLSVSAPSVGHLERKLDRSPFVVGRDPECDLSLELPWISRRHLVFTGEDGGWTVRREGKNEVRLNGAILEQAARLSLGDRIELGPLSIVFEAGGRVELVEGTVGAPTIELPVAKLLSQRSGLARLADAGGRLAAAGTVEEAAQSAATLLKDAIGARTAAVVEGTRVLGSAGPGDRKFRVSRFLVERALESGVTVRVEDASASDLLGARESIAANFVGPVIVAPLGPPARGVLYADRPVSSDSFSEEDAAFATVLAHLLGAALDAARDKARVVAEKEELHRDIARRGLFGGLIGTSAPMQKLAGRIAKVAPTNATVLITGETGSGKELVAREIHERSTRREKSFLAINCAALPDALLESELFGHRRGAFTGADADRRGVFEVAAGGTVFLDEIGELSTAAQAKLLRALEMKEILPLGGSLPVPIDVRLIAATHRELEKESAAGEFRRDLYFRLNLFPLEIPPLRERREDIPALVEHFLAASTEARKKKLRAPTEAALAVLLGHAYPGNVRELLHVIERAAILADDEDAIDVEHLPEDLVRAASCPKDQVKNSAPASFHEAVAEYERRLIIEELERDGWNRTKTAKRLSISRRAFMEKLRRYGIKQDG